MDVGVNAIGPRWVDVEDDGVVTGVPRDGTSSDGRAAVVTIRTR
jgi:hypothetical protein